MAEVLLKVGWGASLNVADRRIQRVTNAEESLIRTAVPGLIRDGAWREEGNFERVGRRRGAAITRGVAARDREQKWKKVETCGEPAARDGKSWHKR
jgi:hypothetical protein